MPRIHARCYPVERLEHLQDVAKIAVRYHEAEIARRCVGKGRPDDAFCYAFVSRPSPGQQVAESLDDDAFSQKICQLCDIPSVRDRLVEGLGERGADEKGEVRVVSFPLGITMAIYGPYS